jgi:hypothetical protein
LIHGSWEKLADHRRLVPSTNFTRNVTEQVALEKLPFMGIRCGRSLAPHPPLRVSPPYITKERIT